LPIGIIPFEDEKIKKDAARKDECVSDEPISHPDQGQRDDEGL
jgi:hypothetical protein